MSERKLHILLSCAAVLLVLSAILPLLFLFSGETSAAAPELPPEEAAPQPLAALRDADAEKACRDICAAAARLDIPLEYNMAGLTLQDRPDGSLGYTRDEFWRIAAEYPVKAIMGCDAHAPSELDVVPAIEEKKAFLHSLGIPVLDTLPGLE